MEKKKNKKIEVSDEFIRIPNPKFDGKECDDIRTIDIQPNGGIKALWCVESKQVKTYLFDKDKWTLEEAKEWVSENAKDASDFRTKALIKRKGVIKEIDGKKRKVFSAIASESVEDREGDVIDVDGWLLKDFKGNSQLLWMHNRHPGHNGLPLGSVIRIGKKLVDGAKKLVAEFVVEDITEFGRTVQRFIEDGFLNAVSVGFMPLERDGNTITKQMLLELSVVPIPALATAQIMSRAKELNIPRDLAAKIIEEKGVVPFSAHKTSPESRAWDAGAAVNRVRSWAGGPSKDAIRWNDYKEMYTWYDTNGVEDFGSYKLAHHDVVSGEMVTVWKGVASAMAALLGARGGTDIPESGRRRVYDHLVKHYEQFDKEAPEFRMVESQELKELFEVEEARLEKKSSNEVKKQIQLLVHYVREQNTKIAKEEKARVEKAEKEEQTKAYQKLTKALTLLDKKLPSMLKSTDGILRKEEK